MSWYEGDRNTWKMIIETVAAEEHRTTLMVEKDTIQSMFLMELSKSNLPFVFKGGTSLSKAYDVINRFSEDIDLAMSRKPTETEKKRAKKDVIDAAEEVGLKLSNPEDIRSRQSYNKYVFEYESLFSEIPLELIVETSFFQMSYPVEINKVYSFVGRFCERRGIKLPIIFDAMTIDFPIQTLERTFIDKVFAICDYRIQNMEDRDSRHLYDIAKLFPRVEINTDLKKLISAVRADRMFSKNNPSAQPAYDIPEMLREIINSHFYEADYNNLTMKLLYEDYSYNEAIMQGIARVAELYVFDYRK